MHYLLMKAYSVDLRKRIVDAVHSGTPEAEAAHTFGVSISSVKRYVKITEEGRSPTPKKAPTPSQRYAGVLMRGAPALLQTLNACFVLP